MSEAIFWKQPCKSQGYPLSSLDSLLHTQIQPICFWWGWKEAREREHFPFPIQIWEEPRTQHWGPYLLLQPQSTLPAGVGHFYVTQSHRHILPTVSEPSKASHTANKLSSLFINKEALRFTGNSMLSMAMGFVLWKIHYDKLSWVWTRMPTAERVCIYLVISNKVRSLP